MMTEGEWNRGEAEDAELRSRVEELEAELNRRGKSYRLKSNTPQAAAQRARSAEG